MFTIRKHRGRTSINDVDDDLLAEILIRLSLKHMVSCKLVSKLWCKLISSICIPRNKSSDLYGLIFNSSFVPTLGSKLGQWNFAISNKFSPLDPYLIDSCLGSNLPFSPSPEDLIDCCNGILLFFDPYSMRYCIFNPSTQQHICFTTSWANKDESHFASLIYDKIYEVVYVSKSGSFNVFSFGHGGWDVHKISLDSSIASSEWSHRSVFLEGSVYRLSFSGHLLRFDVRGISCCQVELPEVVIREAPIGCLGVSQGSICYAWSDHKLFARVWSFVEDEWNLKHTICLQYLDEYALCSDHRVLSQSCVCAFHPTSNVLFVGNPAGIFSYDPDTKRLESICEVKNDKMVHNGEYLVYPFSVNLTPIETYEWHPLPRAGQSAEDRIDYIFESMKKNFKLWILNYCPRSVRERRRPREH